MNVRTGIHAGQSETIDVDALASLVKEMQCEITPLEMLGLARKYCQNFNLGTVAEIQNLIGDQLP